MIIGAVIVIFLFLASQNFGSLLICYGLGIGAVISALPHCDNGFGIFFAVVGGFLLLGAIIWTIVLVMKGKLFD